MAPHVPVDIGEAETCEFPNVLGVVCTSIHGHQHLGKTGAQYTIQLVLQNAA